LLLIRTPVPQTIPLAVKEGSTAKVIAVHAAQDGGDGGSFPSAAIERQQQ
jgi:hypothetical protein